MEHLKRGGFAASSSAEIGDVEMTFVLKNSWMCWSNVVSPLFSKPILTTYILNHPWHI